MPVDLLRNFLIYLRTQKGYSEKTTESYENDLSSFFNSLKFKVNSIENRKKLNSSQVEKHISELIKSGLSPRSANRKLSAIRSFLKYLVDTGQLEVNPAKEIKLLKTPKSLPKYLSFEEIESIFETLKSEKGALAFRNLLMVEILYSAGLRVSELIRLKRQNINLETGYLIVEGKGGKQRLVPFSEQCAQYLKSWIDEERGKLTGWADRNEFIFCNRFGKPISRQGVWKILKKTAEKAGVSDYKNRVSPHVLRHSFATHLLNYGFNLKSLQAVLGHSDISTTQIYTHLNQLRLREIHGKTHPRG
jgi:integrase/recombinase XerD